MDAQDEAQGKKYRRQLAALKKRAESAEAVSRAVAIYCAGSWSAITGTWLQVHERFLLIVFVETTDHPEINANCAALCPAGASAGECDERKVQA